MINADPDLCNRNSVCVKLSYVAGGRLLDKPSYKYGAGVDGIFHCISQFIRLNYGVLGYIPFIIIQPRFRYTTEAKVGKLFKLFIIYTALLIYSDLIKSITSCL